MCGIVGQANRHTPVDADALARARDRLAHRGPDDAGLWLSDDRRTGLGHRRLSIIDLSSAGHQPMVSPCGRYVIVFNGEVYNYLELRRELEQQGRHFTGSGDTEVVLTAFVAWGRECLSRFNGMFALAIFDKGSATQPQRLIFARDRAGKKPFYYRHDADGIAFGSELKTLDTGAGLDPQALNHYLALGYVPGICVSPKAFTSCLLPMRPSMWWKPASCRSGDTGRCRRIDPVPRTTPRHWPTRPRPCCSMRSGSGFAAMCRWACCCPADSTPAWLPPVRRKPPASRSRPSRSRSRAPLMTRPPMRCWSPATSGPITTCSNSPCRPCLRWMT